MYYLKTVCSYLVTECGHLQEMSTSGQPVGFVFLFFSTWRLASDFHSSVPETFL